MRMSEIIIIAAAVLFCIILTAILVFRDKVLKLKQEIFKLRANIRLYKGKYQDVIKKVQDKLGNTSDNGAKVIKDYHPGAFTGNVTPTKGLALDFNEALEFDSLYVEKLYDTFIQKQAELNKKIEFYNVFILRIDNILWTFILGYKKMDFED